MAPDQPWDDVMREKLYDELGKEDVDDVDGQDLSFITPEKLRHVWDTSATQFQEMQQAISTTFHPDLPFENFIKVLSILIVIGIKSWQLVGVALEAGFADIGVPYRRDELARWFASIKGPAYQVKDFLNKQYAFCPIIIREGEDIEYPTKQRRFAFTSRNREVLGHGAFGVVTKVCIAKGCLLKKGDNNTTYLNTRDTDVARKKFLFAADGQLEQSVLRRLRKERWGSDCIMSSFASVRLGAPGLGESCEYNLFFKYAPADLNKFLHGDSDSESHQALNIKSEYITPFALFTQLLGLAHALYYLHREDLRMCHSDLKPDNILIVPSKNSSIGQWKITDFGIASIEPRAPHQAQGIRDYFLNSSAAVVSVRSSGTVPRTDRRDVGPYQPPEVENPAMIPRGERYRAKGDVWSLGCIAVYVLAYALGGNPLFLELEEIMFDASRLGRQGFFYDIDTNGRVGPYLGMVSWIEDIGQRWNDWAVINSDRKGTWVQDTWKELIKPMLTVSIPQRIEAASLYTQMFGFTDRMPGTNVWDVMQAEAFRTKARPTSLKAPPPSHLMVSAPSSSQPSFRRRPISANPPGTVPTRSKQVSNLMPEFVIPSSSSSERPVSGSNTSSTSQYPHPTSPITERSDEDAATRTSRSASSAHQISVRLPSVDVSPVTSTGVPPPAGNVDKYVPGEPHGLQICWNGPKIVMLTKSGVRSVTPINHVWQQDPEPILTGSTSDWRLIYSAGPYILLWNPIAADQINASMFLHHFGPALHAYKQEWNNGVVPNLENVNLVALSARGHVAFRFGYQLLKVFDRDANKLFTWDLQKATRPKVSQSRGNIEAIAFDPQGEVLVVTAWNCWYLWRMSSLDTEGTPSQYGTHSYTPTDGIKSHSSLQILPGGRYFLLHDQWKENLCLCVDTSVSNKSVQLDLKKKPKPQTIAISANCDWLAFLVERSWPNKDDLYYCQLWNGDMQNNDLPSLGAMQKHTLQNIKTVKVEHETVIDAVTRIVYSQNNAFAIVASILKFIEVVPLDIGPVVKKKWWK